MTLVAVDPGEHVGLAWKIGNVYTTTMIHDDVPAVIRKIQELMPTTIIVERFVTAGRISKHGLVTVECAGSMYALAYILGAKLVIHLPGTRKPFQRRAEQMLVGTGRPITDHDKDALAHLLAWEYTHGR